LFDFAFASLTFIKIKAKNSKFKNKIVNLHKIHLMGQAAEEKKYYTLAEYLQHEEESEFRSEFFNGELFPIEATTRRHNNIVQNIASNLRSTFRTQNCEVVTENVKLEAIKGVYYPYPDVMLSCDPDDNDELIIKNPVLIVEVLSPSTADYDRGFKWLRYRKIPSLRYYLIVSQSDTMMEVFSRKDNTSLWTFQEYTDIQSLIRLEGLDFDLPMSLVYERIEVG
jgi:Uma2 family endonuclease